MIMSVFLLHALAMSEPTNLSTRCEQSYWVVECERTNDMALRARRDFAYCASSELRLDRDENFYHAETIAQQCGDLRELCVLSWQAHYRRLFARPDDPYAERHADTIVERSNAPMRCPAITDRPLHTISITPVPDE